MDDKNDGRSRFEGEEVRTWEMFDVSDQLQLKTSKAIQEAWQDALVQPKGPKT